MSDAIVPLRRVWPTALAVIALVLVLGATASLWVSYGSAVFFETLRTGFIACFG